MLCCVVCHVLQPPQSFFLEVCLSRKSVKDTTNERFAHGLQLQQLGSVMCDGCPPFGSNGQLRVAANTRLCHSLCCICQRPEKASPAFYFLRHLVFQVCSFWNTRTGPPRPKEQVLKYFLPSHSTLTFRVAITGCAVC